MKHSFTECTNSYYDSQQNILLTCDFPTDYQEKHIKMAKYRNSRMNHISDKLTLGPLTYVAPSRGISKTIK